MTKDERNLPPLDYASAPRRGSRTFAWPVFISSAMMVGCLELVLLVLIPRMKDLYRDFSLKLPKSTQMVLALDGLMVPLGCIVLATLPFVLGALVPRFWPAPRTLDESAAIARKTRRLGRVIYFAVVLLILAVMYALLIPMVSLIQTLTTPPK